MPFALATMLWIAAFAFMLCLAHAATHAPPEPAAPGVTNIELESMLPEQVGYDMEQGVVARNPYARVPAPCQNPCRAGSPRIKTQQFSAEQHEVGAEKV